MILTSGLSLKPVFYVPVCGQNLFTACFTHYLLVLTLHQNARFKTELSYSCMDWLRLL